MAENEMKSFNANEIVNEQVDLKAYINELVEKLRNDVEVYEQLKPLNLSVGEVRQNIAKLHDYQEDYNICKKCPGVDKCPKHVQHISMYVHKDGDYLTTRFEPCKMLMEKIRFDNKFVFADFPDEWKTSRIKEMDLSEVRRPVINEFRRIVKGTSKRSVFLKGNHKVGKSFLLVTFANEFIALNMGQVAVINANKRFKELADLSYNDKDEFAREMLALSKVPLLIIDDFGQEYIYEYLRDSVVLPILMERSREDKLTFFTSEFSINEIQKLYSVGKNGGEIRGKQLGNILRNMCQEEFDVTGAPIYNK